jgi:hypothetical protein
MTKKKRIPMNPQLPGRYGKMTAEEWDREVEKFDQEFIADRAEPLDDELKARLRQAQLRAKRRGRPPVGKGAKRVLVTIERDLLSESDAYAKSHGLTRAAVIAKGLRKLLKKAS